MTQQQQPEANGSTAESGRCPFRLRKLVLQACLQGESLRITSENIQDAHVRGGGNVADLADLLSKAVGKRITTDGISVSAPNANGDGGGELILLDRRAVSASSRQYDVLVRHLAALVAPNGGNRDRDRLAALFGSASAGDDAAAPLGKRVLQFFVGVANDLWNALDLDFVSPKDLVIGTQDAVCSSYLAAQCIMAILERAPGDGSAVLLHRRDDGENTFESFCREAAGLDASQLLRVVSTSSLNLLLDVMVRAGLATLHDDGKIVAIGGPVDEICMREFER